MFDTGIPALPEKGATTMRRSRNKRMISGVCAGIANQIGLSTFWVRFFFIIAAAIVPGVSLISMLVLYVLMAVILPWDDEVNTFTY